MAEENPPEAKMPPAKVTLREYAEANQLPVVRVAALAKRLGWKLNTALSSAEIAAGLKKAMTERI